MADRHPGPGVSGPLAGVLAILAGFVAIGAAAGVVGAAVASRRTDARVSARTILGRLFSYAVLAALLAAAAATGVAGVAVFVTVLGWLGLREWSDLTDLPGHHRVALAVANVVIIAAVALGGAAATEFLVPGIVAAGILWPVIRPDTTRGARDLAYAALGCVYLPTMLAHGPALVVERGETGAALFVAFALATAASDVGAFVVGRRFGRARLAPTLSPGKTWAGVVGNVIGAALALAIMTPALVDHLPHGVVAIVLLTPIVAIGAVWGDLFESAIKREAQVKDAGALLPGFGGILDRIDSFLLVLPLGFWLLRLVELVP
ncbi:MAG TPA: phosphatidate cytidylyltransferase [Candidatus Limnocylindrales bacterium]